MSGLRGGAGVECATPASAAPMLYAYISRTHPKASVAQGRHTTLRGGSTRASSEKQRDLCKRRHQGFALAPVTLASPRYDAAWFMDKPTPVAS